MPIGSFKAEGRELAQSQHSRKFAAPQWLVEPQTFFEPIQAVPQIATVACRSMSSLPAQYYRIRTPPANGKHMALRIPLIGRRVPLAFIRGATFHPPWFPSFAWYKDLTHLQNSNIIRRALRCPLNTFRWGDVSLQNPTRPWPAPENHGYAGFALCAIDHALPPPTSAALDGRTGLGSILEHERDRQSTSIFCAPKYVKRHFFRRSS